MKQLLLKQFHWLIDDGWARSSDFFLNFPLVLLHDTMPLCGNTDVIAIQAAMFWLQQGY